MPLHVLQCDPGGEIYVAWARKKLDFWHREAERAGLTLVRKTVQVSDGSVIHAWSQALGGGVWMDKIRVTTSGLPATHALLNLGADYRLRLLDANGTSVFLSDALPNTPQLVGISGSGRYTFVISGTTAGGSPIGDTRTLHVFKDLELYQTLTYTFPADTTATFVGFPNDGFLNGGNLISYSGAKAIVPIAVHTGGGQGVLIFNDAATPKLRYFITPAIANIIDLVSPYIATPDLSRWGWLDYQTDAPDVDSVFHSLDASDVETTTIVAHADPRCATFSQNGTLLFGYYKYSTASEWLNIGGVEYALPATQALTRGSLAPWLVSADATKAVVPTDTVAGGTKSYLFSGGAFTALTGTAFCMGRDGSTYAHYDGLFETTIVRNAADFSGGDFWFGNGNSHASALYAFAGLGAARPVPVGWASGFNFAPAGILSTDGKSLRQVGYYTGNKQDLYRLNDAETAYTASTISFPLFGANAGYDNVYIKAPA